MQRAVDSSLNIAIKKAYCEMNEAKLCRLINSYVIISKCSSILKGGIHRAQTQTATFLNH